MKDSVAPQISVVIFGTAEEFRARPFYRDDVVPTGQKPSQIVGSYRLPTPVRCGLKGCDQTHDHGYVVLVADGAETNTGWDCGMDHFGIEFFPMRKQYDRAEREFPFRLSLRQVVTDAERLRKRIHALQAPPHGGEWLLQNLRRFAKLYPPALMATLRKVAPQGEANVFESRLRAHLKQNAAAGRNAGVENNSAHDVREPRGTVCGLKIFTLDLEHWPVFQLEAELNEFLKLDHDTIPFDQVMRWNEWTQALELRLDEYQHLIYDGKKFFRRDNLALLQYLAEEQKTQDELSWMVWGEASAEAPKPPARARPPKKSNSLRRILKRLIPSPQ